jgi:hypothetical protein
MVRFSRRPNPRRGQVHVHPRAGVQQPLDGQRMQRQVLPVQPHGRLPLLLVTR